MDKIILNLHSVIDVITNSSTEMFTMPNANAPKIVADIVNALLKDAGSDLKAEDLYDIKVELDEAAYRSDIKCFDEVEDAVMIEEYKERHMRLVILPKKCSSGDWFDNEEGGTKASPINGEFIAEKLSKIFYSEELEN